MRNNEILAEELLKRCLTYKVFQEWETYVNTQWKHERWYVTFRNATQNKAISTHTIVHLPHGFYSSLAKEINQVIHNKLSLPQRELSRYTISASSLKRFLGKSKQQGNRNEKKKSGLAIYVGFRQGIYYLNDWTDFQQTHQEYLKFWHYWEQNAFRHPQLDMFDRAPQSTEIVAPSFNEGVRANHHRHKYLLLHEVIQQPYVSSLPPPKKNKLSAMLMGISLVLFLTITGWASQRFWQTSLFKPKTKHQKVALSTLLSSEAFRKKIKFKIAKKIPGKNKSTVFLSYDISQVPLDTIKIRARNDAVPQFYYLTKPKGTVSFVVNKPTCYFHLSYQHQRLKTLRVYQESAGWIGFFRHKKTIGAAIETCKLVQNGYLSFLPKLVPDQYKHYYFSHLSNVKHFQVQGNHLTFEARVKLTHKPSDATCNDLTIGLAGSNNNESELIKHIGYKLELDGCEYWLQTKKFHQKIRHANNYHYDPDILERFTHDIDTFMHWNTIKLVTKGQTISYFWNGKKIHQKPFQGTIGEITAIKFGSKGSWAIDWTRLKDSKGQEKYYEDFEDCTKIQ